MTREPEFDQRRKLVIWPAAVFYLFPRFVSRIRDRSKTVGYPLLNQRERGVC